MRAIIFERHDPSPTVYRLSDAVPEPELAPDGVVVKVHYAALNRLDNFVRIGWKGLNLQWPHIPCSDFSGEIVAVGDQVHEWRVGQRVTANPLVWCGRCRACLAGRQNHCRSAHLLGEHIRGACADYVALPARNLITVPEGFDMRLAAAASLVYVTAWHNLLTAGRLRAGERQHGLDPNRQTCRRVCLCDCRQRRQGRARPLARRRLDDRPQRDAILVKSGL
jgi:NADPH:quinone reductase-like Zn-dependent oxidoreductase